VGLRNSHDKTFPAGLVAGTRVFICANLSFSGLIQMHPMLVDPEHLRALQTQALPRLAARKLRVDALHACAAQLPGLRHPRGTDPGIMIPVNAFPPRFRAPLPRPQPRHCCRLVATRSSLLRPKVSRCLAFLSYLPLPTRFELPHRGQTFGLPSSSTCTISFSSLSLRT